MSGEKTSQASPALSQGTVVAGRYTIEALLGEGAFGEVYLAKNDLGGKVVVKVLKPAHNTNQDIVRRFLREPKAAARVSSPHVVQVMDAGTYTLTSPAIEELGESGERPLHFIVMERLIGHDLATELENKGRLPLKDALYIGLAICDGLNDVHVQTGIVHRDLKPENIFLVGTRGQPMVKIMDFGIAHHAEEDASKSRLTRTGSSMGTPMYMAPEQWKNPTGIDHRADIYAVGVILYEMIEGTAPFDGATVEATLIAAATEDPRSMSLADSALEAIVFKAMHRDVAKRFQSVAELIEALEKYARDRSLLPDSPTPSVAEIVEVQRVRPQAETAMEYVSDVKSPPRRSPRRPLLIAIVAAVLTCGIIIGVAVFHGHQQAPTRVVTSAPTPVPTTPVTPLPTPAPTPTVEPPVAPAPTPTVEPPVAPVAQPTVEEPPPRRRGGGHRRHRNNTTPDPGGCHRGPDGENICD